MKCTDPGYGKMRSELAKKQWANPDSRARILVGIRSEVRRKKIGDAHRGKKRPPEIMEKLRLANVGRKHTEKQKLAQSRNLMGRKLPMAQAKEHIELMRTPEYRERARQNTLRSYSEGKHKGKHPKYNTAIERKMAAWLIENNIPFEQQFVFGNRFVCDFRIGNRGILIETDGDYWHRRKDVMARDRSKNAYISACGWTLLRFWETDINKNIEQCGEIIKKALHDDEKKYVVESSMSFYNSSMEQ